ncbi:MAG: hypothetical protein O7H41_21515 [Planctomycetota bacterium]|nr:hypothetical protein [Planctomycetota bacterium]
MPLRVVDPRTARTVVDVALRGGQVVRIHADLDPEGLAQLVGALGWAAC